MPADDHRCQLFQRLVGYHRSVHHASEGVIEGAACLDRNDTLGLAQLSAALGGPDKVFLWLVGTLQKLPSIFNVRRCYQFAVIDSQY